MEFLGTSKDGMSGIWLLKERERDAIWRFLDAVNKVDRPMSRLLSDKELDYGFETLDRLARTLEHGPIKLAFEPVEFKG